MTHCRMYFCYKSSSWVYWMKTCPRMTCITSTSRTYFLHLHLWLKKSVCLQQVPENLLNKGLDFVICRLHKREIRLQALKLFFAVHLWARKSHPKFASTWKKNEMFFLWSKILFNIFTETEFGHINFFFQKHANFEIYTYNNCDFACPALCFSLIQVIVFLKIWIVTILYYI